MEHFSRRILILLISLLITVISVLATGCAWWFAGFVSMCGDDHDRLTAIEARYDAMLEYSKWRHGDDDKLEGLKRSD